MRIAAYVCFCIFGLCITPFVLWLIGATIWCALEGIRRFCKHPEPDALFEFLASLALLSGCIGGALMVIADKL